MAHLRSSKQGGLHQNMTSVNLVKAPGCATGCTTVRMLKCINENHSEFKLTMNYINNALKILKENESSIAKSKRTKITEHDTNPANLIILYFIKPKVKNRFGDAQNRKEHVNDFLNECRLAGINTQDNKSVRSFCEYIKEGRKPVTVNEWASDSAELRNHAWSGDKGKNFGLNPNQIKSEKTYVYTPHEPSTTALFKEEPVLKNQVTDNKELDSLEEFDSWEDACDDVEQSDLNKDLDKNFIESCGKNNSKKIEELNDSISNISTDIICHGYNLAKNEDIKNYLFNKLSNILFASYEVSKNAFLNACDKGEYETIKCILEILETREPLKIYISYKSLDLRDINNGLCKLVQNHYLEVAEWLYYNYMSKFELETKNLFYSACIGGNLEFIEWLYNKECSENVYNWIKDHFNTEICVIKTDTDFENAITKASRYDNLHIIKFLDSKKPENKYLYFDNALISACENNNIEIIDWLVKEKKYISKYTRQQVLLQVQKDDQLEIFKYLYPIYKNKIDEVYKNKFDDIYNSLFLSSETSTAII
jgi:hypothetical protein